MKWLKTIKKKPFSKQKTPHLTPNARSPVHAETCVDGRRGGRSGRRLFQRRRRLRRRGERERGGGGRSVVRVAFRENGRLQARPLYSYTGQPNSMCFTESKSNIFKWLRARRATTFKHICKREGKKQKARFFYFYFFIDSICVQRNS